MNINELYEILINKFSNEDLIGELNLHGNCIIWSYIYDIEENKISNDIDIDDENDFVVLNTEDMLNDIYYDDRDKILTYLDEIDVYEKFYYSEYDIYDNCISFKIY